jgi:hypothetical protein
MDYSRFVGTIRFTGDGEPFSPKERALKMKNITNYLNDHLAGSVAALELVDRLIKTYQRQALGRFFRELRQEIEADQETLKELIHKLGVEESTARKAAGWLAEKLSRPKISVSNSPEGDMGLFLALEALVLGITGKHSLWRALAAASKNNPGLAQVDYAELQQRAMEQRDLMETKRLEAACTLFQERAKASRRGRDRSGRS